MKSVWVYGRCENVSGVSEELLQTRACSGCRVAQYWKAHRESCRARQAAADQA